MARARTLFLKQDSKKRLLFLIQYSAVLCVLCVRSLNVSYFIFDLKWYVNTRKRMFPA